MPMTEAERFWEQRYRSTERVWSGTANPVLVDVVTPLPPGRALDFGCGEGGDVVWLALRGWHVTGVDISTTALRRTVERATAAGVADRVTVRRHELGIHLPGGRVRPGQRTVPAVARGAAAGRGGFVGWV